MVEVLLDPEFEVVPPIRLALEQVGNSAPAPMTAAERNDSQSSTLSLPNSEFGLKAPVASFRATALDTHDTSLLKLPHLTR